MSLLFGHFGFLIGVLLLHIMELRLHLFISCSLIAKVLLEAVYDVTILIERQIVYFVSQPSQSSLIFLNPAASPIPVLCKLFWKMSIKVLLKLHSLKVSDINGLLVLVPAVQNFGVYFPDGS